MIDPKLELIAFRLKKADESFDMANMAASNNYWNTAVSELYYTCFYLVIALLARKDVKTSTHSGVKAMLGELFIREGIIEQKWGKLYTRLFSMRQEGDYGDFIVFSEAKVRPLFIEVKEFIRIVKELVAK